MEFSGVNIIMDFIRNVIHNNKGNIIGGGDTDIKLIVNLSDKDIHLHTHIDGRFKKWYVLDLHKDMTVDDVGIYNFKVVFNSNLTKVNRMLNLKSTPKIFIDNKISSKLRLKTRQHILFRTVQVLVRDLKLLQTENSKLTFTVETKE